MVDLDPHFHKKNSGSVTKHRVWNRCQRQYYFEYIASYVKSAPVVNPEKIKWLKTFTNLMSVRCPVSQSGIGEQGSTAPLSHINTRLRHGT